MDPVNRYLQYIIVNLFTLTLTVLILLVGGYNSNCQGITFNKVLPPEGDLFRSVSGIVQDKYGYIWISTHVGLFKYDGYRFNHYRHDPNNIHSLAGDFCVPICATRDGNIWVGIQVDGKGIIDRFDPKTGIFTHIMHDPAETSSINGNIIEAILEDHTGKVWIGTWSGLECFDPQTGKFIHYRHDPRDSNSLSCNDVRILYEDREGSLWVGTGGMFDWEPRTNIPDDGGLNLLDRNTGKFKRFVHDPSNPNSLINNRVSAIYEDSQGLFWVGTVGDGLHTMDRTRGTFERHLYNPAHPDRLSRPPIGKALYEQVPDRITFIKEDLFGGLWIGSLYNGMNRYDKKTGRTAHFGSKDSTTGYTILKPWVAANSSEGVFWIGTIDDGSLYRINLFPQEIPRVQVAGGVFAFVEEPKNVIWFGTNNEGLIRKDFNTNISDTFKYRQNRPKGLSSNRVYSIFKDLSGALWIGTDSGLNRLNKNDNSFTYYHNDPKNTNTISPGRIWAITGNGKDSLWIGTSDDGLDLLNTTKQSITHFKIHPKDSNKLVKKAVTSLKLDHRGRLWVGLGPDGLSRLDPQSGELRNVLSDFEVNTIFEDSDTTLWAGGYSGLLKSKNEDTAPGFTQFAPLSDKIRIDEVYSIREDDKKDLWVSTQLGIYRIDLKNYQTTLKTASRQEDGPDLIPKIGGFKGADGKIYFGDEQGYFVFSPDRFKPDLEPPKIIFTDFRIGGRSVIPGGNSPLSVPIEETREIKLKYNQNSFDIDFAGINYTDPEKNQHLIMMQNYDTTWRVKVEKTAYYFNLPPANYIFRVKAANNDGVWTERDLKIEIDPPWWQTGWAYALYFVCFLTLIYVTDRFRRRMVIEKERIKTREKQLAQAKEIEKAYTELKAAQAQLIQSEKMASLGELTAGIAHEIQNPLNFVNNFSEINSELIDEASHEVKTGHQNEALELLSTLKENEQKISHHGKRADAIVKGMLQHSRSSSGLKEPTDINALVNEYLRLSYHGLRAKDRDFNVTMKTDFDNSIGKTDIIPQDIGRVLLNLYNNAFYSVSEKKKQQPNGYEPAVSVSTNKIGDKVEIRVKDNGNGIAQKVVDKIFQPFFTTKPTGQGTGLGLSLSYDIVKAHGGEIKVNSKEGEGAEFTIKLSA